MSMPRSPRQQVMQLARRVLVIYTGGTIGMKPSPTGYVPATKYLPRCCAALPMFHDKEYAESINLGADLLVTPVSEYGERTVFKILEYDPLLDSSNMKSQDWIRIARDIAKNFEYWDAFVVLHGTDTMGYTSSALAFMLGNLSKTVVVTGSQIPLVRPRNDAIANFLGALNIAGHFDIPEVCLYFSSNLYRGCRDLGVIDSAGGLYYYLGDGWNGTGTSLVALHLKNGSVACETNLNARIKTVAIVGGEQSLSISNGKKQRSVRVIVCE